MMLVVASFMNAKHSLPSIREDAMKTFRFMVLLAATVGLVACSEKKEEPKPIPEELPVNQVETPPAVQPPADTTPAPEPTPAPEATPKKKKPAPQKTVEQGATVQKKENRDAPETVIPPTVQKKKPRE
jgi:outer membrane biosynthesis protein TonB